MTEVIPYQVAEPGDRVFEDPADFERDARWVPFNGSTGAFHGSTRPDIRSGSDLRMPVPMPDALP